MSVDLIVFLVCWYLIGVASFIYWWTKELSLGPIEVILALIVGVLGPLTNILGAAIHGSDDDTVIIRKRK